MDFRRLVEPAGLLYGAAARDMIARGNALPLAGGAAAFTCVDLIEDDTRSGFIPVASVPAAWQAELARVTQKPVSGRLPDGPLVMGIVNLTPDSFSDGGQHLAPEKAVAAGLTMNQVGARVLDLGGESTRPGAAPVTPQQEWDRIDPALAALRAQAKTAVLSVDTRNSFVMAQALAAGADLINDVSALAHDPDALPLLAEKTCGVVLMHMRGTPETMSQHAVYQDVGYDVVRELGKRVYAAVEGGIALERLVVDPGLGFAKTTEQNRALLSRLPLLANLGCRVLLGVSRKRMIGDLTGVKEPVRRDPATYAATLEALALGPSVLRVHDVEGMVQSAALWRAVHEV
ncbi:dihydropteroate synthase [Acetobacter indonesiensis]|uniref:Dihydropteroate synthase n=1 Tax=Acetobacter indonesiensis TaxID=104101 RepID=A0A252ARZ5_9PROT|nr:dihydropteroate synthase [Acetobacter indonesiensis]OUI92810.1 dihydropteroate synthase [Acetobacter indonesiensis]